MQKKILGQENNEKKPPQEKNPSIKKQKRW